MGWWEGRRWLQPKGARMILPPGAWGKCYGGRTRPLPLVSRYCGLLALGKTKHKSVVGCKMTKNILIRILSGGLVRLIKKIFTPVQMLMQVIFHILIPSPQSNVSSVFLWKFPQHCNSVSLIPCHFIRMPCHWKLCVVVYKWCRILAQFNVTLTWHWWHGIFVAGTV